MIWESLRYTLGQINSALFSNLYLLIIIPIAFIFLAYDQEKLFHYVKQRGQEKYEIVSTNNWYKQKKD